MKLRLQANSIRLRLKRGEVARLVERGAIEESICFFPCADQVLVYRIELSGSAPSLSARMTDARIVVEIPVDAARRWATDDDQVGLEAVQPAEAGAGEALDILVEKDFACLDGTDEQNADTYPNPLEGTKC
jgi:hypothetical protein